MRFTSTIFMAVVSLLLAACGGGGGGGGGGGTSATLSPFARTQVPFYTPTAVGTVTPATPDSPYGTIGEVYTARLSAGGGEDVVLAGFVGGGQAGVNQNQISIFGWQNNSLVNTTSQWFSGTDNVIVGTGAVKFGSFNNNGRTDMVVSSYTDVGLATETRVFMNQGSSFRRVDVPYYGSGAHDVIIADVNQDGYKDIVASDYGWNTTVSFNNQAGGFVSRVQDQRNLRGHSSVAVADFLGNGTTTFAIVDGGQDNNQGNNPLRLYSWNIDSNNKLNFAQIATGPEGRFSLPKWSSFGFGDGTNPSHNIRIIAYDWDRDGDPGGTDAIVISRPAKTNGVWPNYSEVQFLKNTGGGVFVDRTDSVLVNYNTSTAAAYNYKFLDFNGDGLTDILLSGNDYSGATVNNNTQILLYTTDGKYVATYKNVITEFSQQVQTLQQSATPNGYASANGGVNVIQDPQGRQYLVTHSSWHDANNVKRYTVYLSLVGDRGIIAPVDVTTALRQQWPWMSDRAVNDMLSRTAPTYFGTDVKVLDHDYLSRILNPIGELRMAGTNLQISGYITGVNFGSNNFNLIAVDGLSRPFSVNMMPTIGNSINAFAMNSYHTDQHNLTSHSEYLTGATVNTVDGLRLGMAQFNDGASNRTLKNFTIGIPKYYEWNNWSLGMQYTNLAFNPWLSFGGSWGEVTGSVIVDHAVRYQNGGYTAVFGVNRTTTQINPGLISRVNDIWGAWAETGYVWKSQGLGIYAGVKPMVLSGGVEARLPNSIDTQGNIMYTNRKLGLQSSTTTYIRALWNTDLTKRTALRLSGTVMDNGQYRVMNELRTNF